MTQYALHTATVATDSLSPRITKIFKVSAWAEMDRIRIQKMYFDVTMTGTKGSRQPDSLTIDGEPATLEQVATLFTWSKDGGTFDLVAEHLVSGVEA